MLVYQRVPVPDPPSFRSQYVRKPLLATCRSSTTVQPIGVESWSQSSVERVKAQDAKGDASEKTVLTITIVTKLYRD